MSFLIVVLSAPAQFPVLEDTKTGIALRPLARNDYMCSRQVSRITQSFMDCFPLLAGVRTWLRRRKALGMILDVLPDCRLHPAVTKQPAGDRQLLAKRGRLRGEGVLEILAARRR